MLYVLKVEVLWNEHKRREVKGKIVYNQDENLQIITMFKSRDHRNISEVETLKSDRVYNNNLLHLHKI